MSNFIPLYVLVSVTIYLLPSVPGFTHALKFRVCGVFINAEAAPSRPSALALRAFDSLLPFLYGEYCRKNKWTRLFRTPYLSRLKFPDFLVDFLKIFFIARYIFVNFLKCCQHVFHSRNVHHYVAKYLPNDCSSRCHLSLEGGCYIKTLLLGLLLMEFCFFFFLNILQ